MSFNENFLENSATNFVLNLAFKFLKFHSKPISRKNFSIQREEYFKLLKGVCLESPVKHAAKSTDELLLPCFGACTWMSTDELQEFWKKHVNNNPKVVSICSFLLAKNNWEYLQTAIPNHLTTDCVLAIKSRCFQRFLQTVNPDSVLLFDKGVDEPTTYRNILDWNSYENRLYTFLSWSDWENSAFTPPELAKAGFVFLRRKKQIVCSECKYKACHGKHHFAIGDDLYNEKFHFDDCKISRGEQLRTDQMPSGSSARIQRTVSSYEKNWLGTNDGFAGSLGESSVKSDSFGNFTTDSSSKVPGSLASRYAFTSRTEKDASFFQIKEVADSKCGLKFNEKCRGVERLKNPTASSLPESRRRSLNSVRCDPQTSRRVEQIKKQRRCTDGLKWTNDVYELCYGNSKDLEEETVTVERSSLHHKCRDVASV